MVLSFPYPIPTHSNCIPVRFLGHISLLPLAVHFLLTPLCEKQILAQPYQVLACLVLLSKHQDEELLCSKKSGLKFWIDFIICQVPIPQDHELNQGTVATAQADTNLNLFNELR